MTKSQCRAATRYLIKTGELVKGICEFCKSPDVESHHDDYDKPEQVRWVCSSHHASLHPRSYAFNPDAPMYNCRVCGYEWKGRKDTDPVRCPECKRENWATGEATVSLPCSCKRCGYKWDSNKEAPKCCPKCKSRMWRYEKGKRIERPPYIPEPEVVSEQEVIPDPVVIPDEEYEPAAKETFEKVKAKPALRDLGQMNPVMKAFLESRGKKAVK